MARAVLLLHDVFGYPFDQVAAAVDRSPAAVRQVASRTRRRIAEARPGWEGEDGDGGDVAPVPAPRRRDVAPDVLLAMTAAVAEGDVETLLDLLAPDVVAVSDGGPLQRAARRPIVGGDRVARTLVNLNKRSGMLDLVAQVVEVNGELGMAFHHPDGSPFLVLTAETDAAGRVDRLYLQLNPDKLASLR